MIRLFFLSLCLIYTMPSCVEVSAAKPEFLSAIPVLMVKTDTASRALQISKLNIDLKVTGNIATTTFDISFYNPADKILEGEFDFPLADGQNICRYALDINGILREGVVVEKATARVAFENIIRKGIDPGLVEKTRGNNFRTRIYPIPARGYKRVVIGIEQTLASVKEGLVYRLPLAADQPMKEFGITAAVYKTSQAPALQGNTLQGFNFEKNIKGWEAKFAATNFTAAHTVEFLIPETEAQVYTETYEGNTYFYGHAAVAGEYRDKPNPASIILLWDISASAGTRNIKKEISLLEAYFDRIKNVSVTLVPFNITMLPNEPFAIKSGDAGPLLRRLQSFSFDGGTQFGAIDLKQFSGEEILLFTDGLSTFGKRDILLSNTPVSVINSSSSTDYSFLKFIAHQTNGHFINLNDTEPMAALENMAKLPYRFVNATYNDGEIAEFFTQTQTQLQNGFSFAGILKKGTASITLNFGYGNKVTSSKTISINSDDDQTDNIKRIWASTKVAHLDLEYEKNKEAITELGKQFSIVTQNTSLLVLDRVEDYVEYEITPPAELQKEYFALLKEKQQMKTDEKKEAYDQALSAMREIKNWYGQSVRLLKRNKLNEQIDYSDMAFSNGRAENVPAPHPNLRRENVTTDSAVSSGSTHTAATPFLSVENEGASKMEDQNKAKESNSEVSLEMAKIAEPPKIEMQKFSPPVIVKDEEVKEDESPAAVSPQIQLSEWASEATYLKELGKVAVSDQPKKYLSLKKDYLKQPSFFVDVARFFYEKSNKTMALQVLSNIAEMKLENPELLRVLANQLIEFGETELAIETFKEVLNIRVEEPQSYRDLALAYIETGKYQLAVDLLYQVVTGTWDERFGGIKSIALNEMNAVISGHAKEVNIAGIDKQFIQSMPMDVRIVIGWSSNDSDIDLWVTDPAKEKCSYENTTTSGGGIISGDVTQGYGPEEFCVRKARNGNYEVDVNLYGDTRQTLGGPITIKAELFTNFGRTNQQRKVINCRVVSDKELIQVGVLHFGM
ncbi:MAG: VIT domain-containing protein [Bacteroidota bacterium]